MKCGKAGRLEVDHIVPINVDPDQDRFRLEGLRALCRGCHIALTAAQNRKPMTKDQKEWSDLLKTLSTARLPRIAGALGPGPSPSD